MITHVALFRFKPTFTAEAREEWRTLLLDLPNQIDFMSSLEVGDDQLHGAKSWDAAVVAKLDTIENVPNYINHPLHQAAGALSAPHIEQLALVDFES